MAHPPTKINFLSIIPPFFHLDKCAEKWYSDKQQRAKEADPHMRL